VLENNRTVTLRYDDGKLTDDFIYQLREDNDCEWLFVSHCCEPYNKDVFRSKNLRIILGGERKVSIYDTLTGEIYPADVDYTGGNTVIRQKMYDYDSLLLKIEDGKNEAALAENEKELLCVRVSSAVPYTLDEKNVLLLDSDRLNKANCNNHYEKRDRDGRPLVVIPIIIKPFEEFSLLNGYCFLLQSFIFFFVHNSSPSSKTQRRAATHFVTVPRRDIFTLCIRQVSLSR
jgi:hypothetical protein